MENNNKNNNILAQLKKLRQYFSGWWQLLRHKTREMIYSLLDKIEGQFAEHYYVQFEFRNSVGRFVFPLIIEARNENEMLKIYNAIIINFHSFKFQFISCQEAKKIPKSYLKKQQELIIKLLGEEERQYDICLLDVLIIRDGDELGCREVPNGMQNFKIKIIRQERDFIMGDRTGFVLRIKREQTE